MNESERTLAVAVVRESLHRAREQLEALQNASFDATREWENALARLDEAAMWGRWANEIDTPEPGEVAT